MQLRFVAGLLFFMPTVVAAGQSSCSADALPRAAKNVAEIRHRLHAVAVPLSDPKVPGSVATDLLALKSALAQAAAAAFACAEPSATEAAIQKSLADALDIHPASATETTEEVSGKKDVGAYGSDLSVQVFPLFGKPKLVEVDFRYGIECGDDNLLMVFEATGDTPPAWTERLRWGASSYTTIADAVGDFAMLTPLTGDYKHPLWRYVVAHGRPACGDTPRPSTFSLDLLRPTPDPAKPSIDWHFDHAYTEGAVTPRLATTEDTIEFRLAPLAPDEKARSSSAKGDPPAIKATTPASPEVYRFHLEANGQVLPTTTTTDQEKTRSDQPHPDGDAQPH